LILGRLLPALALPALLMGQADRPRATITVKVLTTFGETIEGALVSMSSVGARAQFKKTGGEVRFEGLPFDRYVIEAKAPGFVTQRETIGVYQEQALYRMGLPLGITEASSPTEISGRVIGPVSPTNLWIRLVAVYEGGLIQCQIDQSSRYRFVSPDPGRYLLLLFDGGHLLGSKEVNFVGGKLSLDFDVGRK